MVKLLKRAINCVGKNDCEHVEHCNIACMAVAAFIKHYCYAYGPLTSCVLLGNAVTK